MYLIQISSALRLTFLMPNDCFSVSYLLYEKLIYKSSVKIEKNMNKVGFLMVLNSFERSFQCPFNIMSVQIMSVQIRYDKAVIY